MSNPWYDIAASKLDPEDSLQKSYSCTYDKGNGYLCLGKRKLVFVRVKGFLRKSYDVTLDLPYDELDEVKLESRFKFALTHNDAKHFIETSDLSAKVVLRALQDVIENTSTVQVAFVEH